MALAVLYETIDWNLSIIEGVNTHRTLMVIGDKLQFDTRYFQSFFRTIGDDSRNQIVHTINKTFVMAFELLSSYNHSTYFRPCENPSDEHQEIAAEMFSNLQNMNKAKQTVIQGLQNLASFQRYANDASFKLDVEKLIKMMTKICDKCDVLCQRYVTRS